MTRSVGAVVVATTLVLDGAVDFNGTFSTTPVVTIDTDTDTTARTIDIVGATGLPASFSLDNDVTMTLSATQANALTVAGAGAVIVTGLSATDTTDLGAVVVATTLVLDGAGTCQQL